MFSRASGGRTVAESAEEAQAQEWVERRWSQGYFGVSLAEITDSSSIKAAAVERAFRSMERSKTAIIQKVHGRGLVAFKA